MSDGASHSRALHRLTREEAAHARFKAKSAEDGMIGQNAAFRAVLKEARLVAPAPANVLIFGETGTGKELLARTIHRFSPLRQRAFVKFNCAAIPASVLESALFGHEPSSLPGAPARKVGRLEQAHGGTLFLDEIGDLPLELQPKLLRVLEEREFVRLGATDIRPVKVRIIAASSRDLLPAVEAGAFRGDLYYRLNVFPLCLPALRERPEDIPLLARHFLERYSQELGRPVETIDPRMLDSLAANRWLGNVRELKNVIERAVLLSHGKELQPPLAGDRLGALGSTQLEAPVPRPAGTLADSQREHILKVLQDAAWVVGGPRGAAAQLGLKRTTLLSKMEKLGIDRRRGRVVEDSALA